MNSDEVRLGDVTYDPTTRTLTLKGGHPAQLRNKSKEVLHFLVNNPSRTVTKTEFLDTVWADVTVSDESLVQCIADIRRVIGKDARQIVETIPREGYRINLGTESPSRHRLLVLLGTGVAVMLVAIWGIWPDAPVIPLPVAPTAETPASTSIPGTDITEAYLEVLKGVVSAGRYSRSESLNAERNFRRAIDLDPTYARAYGELGTLFAVRFENNWTVLQDADREKALFYAEKAVELDPDLWLGHYALGRLHSVFGSLDVAGTHLERAMSLQPGNPDARAYFGIVKNFQGDAASAVAILEPTLNSHPNPPYWYYLGLGNALLFTDQYEAAEKALDKCLELAKDSPYCLRYMIAVYGETGRVADAEATSRVYASMGFDPTVGSIMSLLQFHHPDDRARLETAFRQAGLPE